MSDIKTYFVFNYVRLFGVGSLAIGSYCSVAILQATYLSNKGENIDI